MRALLGCIKREISIIQFPVTSYTCTNTMQMALSELHTAQLISYPFSSEAKFYGFNFVISPYEKKDAALYLWGA